jgi:hypothetical protein
VRTALLAALACSACERRFVSVDPGIEWLAWVELDAAGALADASTLFEVGEARVFAVDRDHVELIGFEGIEGVVRGSAGRWASEPLIAATPCDPRLAPSWREPGSARELPPITAPWVVDACGADGIATPACAPCGDCGLERIDYELVIPGASTEAALHQVVPIGDHLLGTLRPPELEPGVSHEHVAVIRFAGGQPVASIATPLPGISRGIVAFGGGAAVATSAALVMLDADGTVRESHELPFATEDDIGIGALRGSLFVYAYKEPLFERAAGSTAAILRGDLPDDIYDLAVDAESDGIAALTIGRIDCQSTSCDEIFLDDTTYVSLDFARRARVALVDGLLVFGWRGQPVRRRTRSEEWEELGWPADDTEPRAFAAFQGGILIGGHRGLIGGLVYFERGAERCTFGVDAHGVNDIVVMPGQRSAYVIAGSALNERLIELRAR